MTPAQKERANEIFTSEKIIDVSKAISNEAELQKKVDSLQSQLRLANDIIEAQSENNQNLINEISFLTGVLQERNAQADKIADEEKKVAEKVTSRFQLSPYLFLQDFSYKQINFSLNLTYSFKQFYLMLSGGTISTPELSVSQRQLFSTIGIGYNIFSK